MARKMTKAEQYARMEIPEILKKFFKDGDTKLQTLYRAYKAMKVAYDRRVESFHRRHIYSAAEARYAENSNLVGLKAQQIIGKLKKGSGYSGRKAYNTLVMGYAQMQSFFRGKTSTVEGIEQFNKEQDERIFGNTHDRMTEDQRKEFWNLYNEFMNQNPNATSKYGSNVVQQMLADMQFSGTRFSQQDLSTKLDLLKVELDYEKQQYEHKPNVYAGSWDN